MGADHEILMHDGVNQGFFFFFFFFVYLHFWERALGPFSLGIL